MCGVRVRRHSSAYESASAQGNEGVAGARRAQFAVASAMNELMHLSEEFDLPNAAPATLQVIARPECLPLRLIVPDAERDVGDLVGGADIQRTPTHARPAGKIGRESCRERGGQSG